MPEKGAECRDCKRRSCHAASLALSSGMRQCSFTHLTFPPSSRPLHENLSNSMSNTISFFNLRKDGCTTSCCVRDARAKAASVPYRAAPCNAASMTDRTSGRHNARWHPGCIWASIVLCRGCSLMSSQCRPPAAKDWRSRCSSQR
jgi:hypothetical protein